MSKVAPISKKLQDVIAELHALRYDINELAESNIELSSYETDIDDTVVPVLARYVKSLNELITLDDPLLDTSEGENDVRIQN